MKSNLSKIHVLKCLFFSESHFLHYLHSPIAAQNGILGIRGLTKIHAVRDSNKTLKQKIFYKPLVNNLHCKVAIRVSPVKQLTGPLLFRHLQGSLKTLPCS